MKIGILGGTFNPIHKGHIKLAEKVKGDLNLDQVWLIPTHKTPDKIFSVERISSKHRYNITKEAVKKTKHKWLKVKDIEIKNKGISYTWKTISQIKNARPTDELFFIMGDDRYLGFESWENSDMIKEQATIVVVNRDYGGDYDFNEEGVVHIKDFDFPISSSKTLERRDWNNIPSGAKEYISKHNLYLKSIVFNTLKENRYQHSVSVASHSKRLAKRNFFRKWKDAELAGLIHDLFKLDDIKMQVDYITDNTEWELPPQPALHGYAAAIWLEKEYGIKNKGILRAVKNHTLARPGMTKIEKIVFVADKISSDRKGHFYGRRRKLAYYNLNLTYKKILKETIDKLESKGIEPHPLTIAAYNEVAKPSKQKTLKENKKYEK